MIGRSRRAGLYAALCLASAIVGCSGKSGAPIAPILSGPTVTATPTIAASSTPAPTPTPVALATSNLSSLNACSFFSLGSGSPPPAVTIPGNYSLFITEGNLVGTNYTQAASEWLAFNITGTPTPTAPPTASPVPTPSPVPTGTVISYDVFTGTYTIPSFTVTASPVAAGSAAPSPTATPIVVSQTVGCTIFIVTADRSPIGSAPQASPTPLTINSLALGVPNLNNGSLFSSSAGQTITDLATGLISTFTLTNLTSSGGSASFTLDSGVGGNVTFGPEQIYTQSRLRALQGQIERARGRLGPRR